MEEETIVLKIGLRCRETKDSDIIFMNILRTADNYIIADKP